MNFKEIAIQAYHKAEQEAAAWRADQADGFAKRAVKVFGQSIVETDVVTEPIDPQTALLVIDDIEIQAREEYGGIEFDVISICPKCGENIGTRIATLADIGKALKAGPPACKHCEAKQVLPGGWPDQMADALREAVYEALS